MKIAESSVNLSSQHTAVEEYHRKESLTYWTKGKETNIQDEDGILELQAKTNIALETSSVKVSLSSASIRRASTENGIQSTPEEEVIVDLNIRILRAMIERLTGKKIRLEKYKPPETRQLPTQQHSEIAGEDSQVESAGFGLAYDLHESYFEAETTSFNATGTIATVDGAEVEFALEVNMSRQFYEENNVSLRMGDALKDPLVINFDGQAAQLGKTKFAFDIDADGEEEQISFVTERSGFLAVDKNGDGLVNDGSELFGALTGNGFAELSGFDGDKNGWIDENDSIFDRLRIWTKNAAGEDQLLALGQKGIGALYLDNISTSFDLKSEDNVKQGQIQSSGIYLTEDFQVGTMQKVDLVV